VARRPEPLEELLPAAKTVIVGVVTRILKIGPRPPPPAAAKVLPKGATSVGYVNAFEKVEIKIERVLKGVAVIGGHVVAMKPVAPYSLRVGNSGPFMLDEENNILGRYGPDSHPLEKIERALQLAR
jgi:hypothetical protein